MKKILILLFLFLQVLVFSQSKNWYVSTASSGNASGNSWANKAKFSTFNWGTVQPGDTAYLDGGTDSVVYDVNQYEVSTHGTVALPITITKGIDAGHNGKAVFRNTSPNYIGMELADITNTIFYNLEWKGSMNATGETWLLDFGGNNIKNVTFLYCTFILNYSCGVGTNSGASSENIKFLYCNSYNNLDTGTNSSADQFWLGGPNHKNWEFAYCNIINANPKTGATVAGTHRDLMQCEWNWGRGGIFKLHHNFFDDRSAGAAGACIESEHLEGNWLIYNNVFKTNSTGANSTGHFSTLSLTANYGAVGTNSIEVYNNTFYCTTRWGRSPSFLGWDNLTFKNNIIYLPNPNNTWFIMAIDSYTWNHSIDSDYNQFYNINSNYIANESGTDITWTQWRAAGYDAHSTLNTDTPDFINATSLVGTDYALTVGSDGINDGTTIALVTDDYLGIARPQGSAYDLGAFEYSESSGGDTTPPNLQGAVLNNSTILILNFSETLNSNTAQNKSNYTINNGISVSTAVLSGTQVTLTTSAHLSGSYLVTVNNVTDLAGNIINPNNNTANYNYNAGDVTPPQVVSATVIDSVKLKVYFSENLEANNAQNISNYNINGISIMNATLNTNVVTLITSAHTSGTYSIIVSNVTDLSGNAIDPQQNSAIYEYQSGPGPDLLMFPVGNVLASVTPEPNHTGDKTIDGKGYYQDDPDSRWSGNTMPEWLVYDLGDVQVLNVTKLSFFKWNLGRIFSYSIQVSTDSVSWAIVRSVAVSILDQEWSIEEVGPIDARYVKIIFINNNQNNWAGLWEAEFFGHLKIPANNEDEEFLPLEFSLAQNYPNPFNPSTKISWQTSVGSYHTIKVYDILGNEVATLVDEFKPAGNYEVEFNTSSTARELTSGVYFYRLQTTPSAGSGQAFTETKKMVLLR